MNKDHEASDGSRDAADPSGGTAPRAAAFFSLVTAAPRTVLLIGVLFVLVTGSFLPRLVKDTTIDAFIHPDNAAIQLRDEVKAQFGLKDPIVVAVAVPPEQTIFTPERLTLVRSLTEIVRATDNVDPERVVSLATESAIEGTEDALLIETVVPDGPLDAADAARALGRVRGMEVFRGRLVAYDESATVIVAELVDGQAAGQTYQDVVAAIDAAGALKGDSEVEVHVAGAASVDGFLGAYIDRDARKLQPLIFVVILTVLFLAFRTKRSVGLPLFVVLATNAGALGIMAACGVPYFAITSALPVILVGISVADSIHVLAHYYQERKEHPELSSRALTVRSLSQVWRPLVLTSLTTAFGFAGIALTSIMPPLMWFAVFAITGITVALVFSLTVLPAALSLCPASSCAPIEREGSGPIAKAMTSVGLFSARRPVLVTSVTLAAVLIGLVGASRLTVERQSVANFRPGEPVRVADTLINDRFSGTTYLDVVVTAPDDQGLYEPEALARIEALQDYAEALPHVGGSVSIVDHLKALHRAVEAGDPGAYALPDDRALVEQLFLVHSASADPTEFEDTVDSAFRTALVRISLNTGLFTEVSSVVQEVQAYVDREAARGELAFALSGRAALDYHWLTPLRANHLQSLAVSVLLVWLSAMALFRSALAGTLALLPVVTAVLMVYAVMGFGGVWLEPATSIFAPIAIGLGADFSIHVIDRVRYYAREEGLSLERSLARLLPLSGRALFFNCAAIFLGFGVLLASELPTLTRFGGLTMVAIGVSFTAALVLLPALMALLSVDRVFRPVRGAVPVAASLAVVLAAGLLVAPTAQAQDEASQDEAADTAALTGEEVARRIAERPEPENSRQTITMTLTDRKGKERKRVAAFLRKSIEEERRTIIAFERPRNIRGTAFMTHDLKDPGATDLQWLYLPALKRSRRISAADRGDYFLGTDFTYEDVKDSTKFSLSDYAFENEGTVERDGRQLIRLALTARTEEIAEETGYSRAEALVDPANWMPAQASYWDVGGNALKTVTITEPVEVDGYWTPSGILAVNHKTGHQTLFEFTDIDFGVDLEMSMFTERLLREGF